MNGTRPLCDCKQQAMARVEGEGEPPRFLCSECTIRALRVIDVQGKLIDVRVFDPGAHLPEPEQAAAPVDAAGFTKVDAVTDEAIVE